MSPKHHPNYEVEAWRAAPSDPKFEDQISFALSWDRSDEVPGLNAQFDKIRTALQQETTYYAFYIYGESSSNIDMFIVDLKNAILIEINHDS